MISYFFLVKFYLFEYFFETFSHSEPTFENEHEHEQEQEQEQEQKKEQKDKDKKDNLSVR